MSIAERWEVIEQRKTEALVLINQNIDNCKSLLDTLEQGVDISVANRIISEMWIDDQYSRRIKTRLSASFPKENGDILSNARLGPADMERWFSEKAQIAGYFDTCHAFINDLVVEITEKLGTPGGDSETKLVAYNEFRRQCLTYLLFIESWSWEARDSISEGNCNSWDELVAATPIPSGVDNGDYLFIDDFVTPLKVAQANYTRRVIGFDSRTQWSIREIRWVGDRIAPQVAIQYLFAQYLTRCIEG